MRAGQADPSILPRCALCGDSALEDLAPEFPCRGVVQTRSAFPAAQPCGCRVLCWFCCGCLVSADRAVWGPLTCYECRTPCTTFV